MNPLIEQLPDDLKIIMQKGAKVYLKTERKQGSIVNLTDNTVAVNTGTKKIPSLFKLTIPEFIERLQRDTIVAFSRVTMPEGANDFIIKPRLDKKVAPVSEPSHIITVPSPIDDRQRGYINEKTGRFSKEPKKGYKEITYEVIDTEEVTLTLTQAQLKQLKELGII